MVFCIIIIAFHIATLVSAWAHHPVAPPEARGDRPDNLIWVLGIGVFLVVFIATWAVFSLVERRQRLSAHRQESVRGS